MGAFGIWQASLKIDGREEVIGKPGFSVNPSGFEGQSVVDDDDNWILRAPYPDLVELSDESIQNVVAWGASTHPKKSLGSRVEVKGSRNVVWIEDGFWFRGVIRITGDDNFFYFGAASSCNNGTFVMRGDRTSIIFGNGCMLSFHVSARAADSHGIFDVDTTEFVNPPQSIVVGPHVWAAEGVSILKGVKVGAGSILGAGALVTKDIPEMSLAVGAPAKVIRERVSWTRAPKSKEEAQRRLRELAKL